MPPSTDDTLSHLLALPPHSPLRDIRNFRPKVTAATQSCEDLLLGPAGVQAALGSKAALAERLALASTQCRSAGVAALADAYCQRAQHAAAGAAMPPELHRLLHAPDDAPLPAATSRLGALVQYARDLEQQPARSQRGDLHTLAQHGLDAPATVLLAQSIGFTAYHLRLLAGLRALDTLGASTGLAEAPTTPQEPAPADAQAFVHPAKLPPPGQALNIAGFTSQSLDWKAWLPLPDTGALSAEQQAVLDLSHPKARQSDFYLLLVHQPQVLQQRSLAFNAIMYAPGGLPRAEREIAATAVSRANGCVYCAAVHAQRFEQLSRRNDVIAQIFAQPETAGTNARERAIIQASMALSLHPGQFATSHLLPLHQAGLTAREILDLLHVVSLFAWANRLMLNLGQLVQPIVKPQGF